MYSCALCQQALALYLITLITIIIIAIFRGLEGSPYNRVQFLGMVLKIDGSRERVFFNISIHRVFIESVNRLRSGEICVLIRFRSPIQDLDLEQYAKTSVSPVNWNQLWSNKVSGFERSELSFILTKENIFLLITTWVLGNLSLLQKD